MCTKGKKGRTRTGPADSTATARHKQAAHSGPKVSIRKGRCRHELGKSNVHAYSIEHFNIVTVVFVMFFFFFVSK